MRRRIIALSGVLLFVAAICVVLFNHLENETVNLDSVSINESNPQTRGSFAIMVENDDGDYEEYTASETWPSGMVLNSTLTYCKDSDGTLIDNPVVYENGYATVTRSDTAYCILYFRNYGTTASLEYINVMLSNGTTYTCTDTTCSYTAGAYDETFTLYAATSDGSYETFKFSNSTTEYTSSATSGAYTLTAASTTTATVKVTSEDGNTTKTYTINVYKPDDDSTLSSITASSGTWSTVCSLDTTTCTLTVANSVTSVTLTPIPTSDNATASAVTLSSLSVGSNTTTITVTAEDGTTTKYTVTVVRAASSSTSSSSSSSSSSSTSSSTSYCTGTKTCTCTNTSPGLGSWKITINECDSCSNYTYIIGLSATTTGSGTSKTVTYSACGVYTSISAYWAAGGCGGAYVSASCS